MADLVSQVICQYSLQCDLSLFKFDAGDKTEDEEKGLTLR